MKRKILFILLNCLIILSCKTKLPDQVQSSATSSQPNWLIPDAITAEKIAKTVWEAILDEERMKSIVLKAELKEDSIWVVKSLKKQFYINGKMVNATVGGGLTLELSRRNSRIKKIEVQK